MATANAKAATKAPDIRQPPDTPESRDVDPTHDDAIAEGIIITIDGPAGTGKSTVAKKLADRLGLDFLDTGAMYRAAAAICIDKDIDPEQTERFVQTVASADLHFDWRTDPPAILAWDQPLGDRIRDHDVTRLVSPLAAVGDLRRHMVRKQRIIAHQHPRLVTEGRDQGSVAFPDAAVKFYLDARPDVRAKRRQDQLERAARPVPPLEEMLKEIKQRDDSDRSRTDGPLVCPHDAHVVDTSDLSLTAVLDRLESIARAHIPALNPGPDRS